MRKISAFLLIVSLMLIVPISAYGATLYVDDDDVTCSGNSPCYPHPQDAVNAANPDDTIMVYPGTYDSRQYTSPTPPHWSAPNDQWAPALIVYKDGLTIEAFDSDPTNTIIQTTHDWWSNPVAIQASTGGAWNGTQYVGAGVYPTSGTAPNAIAVIASDVIIKGFTLRKPYAGVAWDGFRNTAGVMIGGLYAGDPDHLGSDGNTVKNCIFRDVWHAVYIWHSSDNEIVDNTVEALGITEHWAAIEIYDGYNNAQIGLGFLSQNNNIANNQIADKGIFVGAWDPPTWTDNSGTYVYYNVTTQIGFAYSTGPKYHCFNTTPGGDDVVPWLYNADMDYSDCDDDGVIDTDDHCPGTVADDPSKRLGTNRWIWNGDDWETNAPSGKGPDKGFTIDDTLGCSCEQILAILEEKTGFDFDGHYKFGCASSILDDWIYGMYYLETVEVPAFSEQVSSPTVVDSQSELMLGVDYLLKATGIANAGDTIDFDAKYSITKRIPLDTWTDTVSGYEAYGPTLLDLFVNGSSVDWGAYNDAHEYSYELAGDGNPVSFNVNDIYCINNTGSLFVDISAKLW